MRYPDIEESEDPLFYNLTTESPYILGVFAQETDVYLRIDDGKRIKLLTDIGGKFEYTFDLLEVGQVVTFEYKNGTKYVPFWTEAIRE
ncbi:hypothetical protein [Listeria fleischmannii]|uniref:Uncharacterized protein n=1 Tax=Listeria fleischmannii FSL S10-1203 TaxID=1265822 RepID=W7DEB5_9LIST|nr:hypothetical protein [Listeria fleischmannii]EUJ47650.1 hypothetical protein MCOL2_18059 [Listeria fleischmannii FSL S10-1203]